jgi:transcriptional regulator with PAS, ATPase and Fis domain
VFITGESGVGKENIARIIHEKSPRSKRDFTAINCASIPENLVESELFGHIKGSFTGADRDNPGLFVNAHMGTLFLDEVAELSLAVQAKLLRVIQEMEVRPVGGKKPVAIDVRIICATHRNIQEMIEEGKFRSDLFYRLNVIPINVKPLRERPEDLKQLINYFVTKMKSRFKLDKSLSQNAMNFLIQYNYPGNVRELQNLLERAFIFCTGDKIETTDFNLQPSNAAPQKSFFKLGATLPTLEQVEMAYIKEVLGNNQSKKKAAEILGIGRKTLFRKEISAKQSV